MQDLSLDQKVFLSLGLLITAGSALTYGYIRYTNRITKRLADDVRATHADTTRLLSEAEALLEEQAAADRAREPVDRYMLQVDADLAENRRILERAAKKRISSTSLMPS